MQNPIPLQRAVVKRRHTRLAEELNNVTEDPSDLSNLAVDPKHSERLKTCGAISTSG
jgi:hypothetical protein